MLQFPDEPKALTAAWLNTILREVGVLSNVTLTVVHMDVPDRTGILGTVVRCHLAYDLESTSTPNTLIVKFAPLNPDIRRALFEFGMSRAEVRFYQQLAQRSGVPTPHCYYAAIDPATGAFVLVLEDLISARPGSWLTGCTPDEAHDIVCAIAKLHATWWDSPRLATFDWLTVGVAKPILSAITSAWQPFLVRVGESVPAPLIEIGRRLALHIDDIEAQQVSRPRTLIHNDLHLDNIFFDTPNRARLVKVIDWQFLAIGQGMKDVAFFLGGNLPSADRRAHEEEILRGYHTALQDEGVIGYSFEQCIGDYRLALLDAWSRFIFSVGTYREPDDRLPFLINTILPRFYAAILDMQAGEYVPV